MAGKHSNLTQGKLFGSTNGTLPIRKLKKHALTGTTIVLDPGHGGNDSGALYRKNLTKKTIRRKDVHLKVCPTIGHEIACSRGPRNYDAE